MRLLKRTKRGQKHGEKSLLKRIRKVTDNCEACLKTANPASKAKNTNMRSVTFNERIAIDLSEWFDIEQKEKVIICHMIDEFLRLSSAGIIKTKEPQAVLQCVLNEWVSKNGAPKILLSDNGGEFINDYIRLFLDR